MHGVNLCVEGGQGHLFKESYLRLTRLKRVASGGAALVLGAAVCAVIGLSAPAGAVNNNPAGNPSSPAIGYESDCTSTLQAGVAAPFISTTVINTTSDTLAPTGATFGVAGVVSQTLAGAVVAGINAALDPASVGLGVTETFGSTDGHATGTYTYTKSFPLETNPGGQVTGVSWSASSTTLNGNFAGVGAGEAISGGLTAGITSGAVSTAPGTATGISISIPTSVAGSGASVGYAPATGITFTDAAFATPTNAFTTAGSNGSTAGIGIIQSTSFTLATSSLSIPFGGTPGVGASNCLETGWVNATTPGPAQIDETAPALPFGYLTALTAATPTFQPGAYVNLTDTAPTPNDQTVSIGEGGTGSVTLTATAGSYPVNPNGFTLVTASPVGSLTFTLGAGGVVSLSNTATSSETDTFQFNACDTLAAGNGGPVCSTTPGTITVVIGTPPVIQPFTEQVAAGQLELSCNSPANYITPAGQNQSPAPTGINPLLQCPEFQFPAITLDGLEQTVSATTGNTGGTPSGSAPGTIYISDNRGSPTDTWTLTGTFVPTAIGSGNGQNPNASCAGVDAFCNSTIGAAALNTATNGAHDGQIAPNYLEVSSVSCDADATGGTGGAGGGTYEPPNLNPNATPLAAIASFGSPVTLCTAAVGQSGGTFLYNATYSLTIPESVYAGNYVGSVQYTVA